MKSIQWLLGLVMVLMLPVSAMAGSATLTWTANGEGDLAGYKVYRGNGVCAVGPLQPLIVSGSAISLGKVTTYTDNTVPTFDGDLCYEITAFDTANNESTRSVRATRAVNLVPPVPPVGLTIVTVTP